MLNIRDFVAFLESRGILVNSYSSELENIENLYDLEHITDYIDVADEFKRLVFIIAVNRVGPHYLNHWKKESDFIVNIFEGRNDIPTHIIIHSRANIGEDCIIEPNTVIGATGQGFADDPKGNRWIMPQSGGVIIGNNCFIGANVTICQGTLRPTRIENNVRIAHGTQIGHNVIIQENTFIANGVSIAGSVIIGKNCFIGSGVTIKNKVKLANNTTVGCGAVVIEDILEENCTIVGNPAKIIKKGK